jgi:hypothetical protein
LPSPDAKSALQILSVQAQWCMVAQGMCALVSAVSQIDSSPFDVFKHEQDYLLIAVGRFDTNRERKKRSKFAFLR